MYLVTVLNAKRISMKNHKHDPDNSELIERLSSKEEAQVIPDWEVFKRDWLTLREASELIDRSDRYVRKIIDTEKMESKIFVGGHFGKKPTRCVRKKQLIEWFQANMDKKPEHINIQSNNVETPQDQALSTPSSFRDLFAPVLTGIAELNDTIKNVSAQMASLLEKIAGLAKDLNEQKNIAPKIEHKPIDKKTEFLQSLLYILIIVVALAILFYLGSITLTIISGTKK